MLDGVAFIELQHSTGVVQLDNAALWIDVGNERSPNLAGRCDAKAPLGAGFATA